MKAILNHGKQLGLVEMPRITDEMFVKAHHPGAEVHGRKRYVWIEDNGKRLGDKAYNYALTADVRAAAWKSAAEFVTDRKHLIEELCFIDAAILHADPASPSMPICQRIKARLVREFKANG